MNFATTTNETMQISITSVNPPIPVKDCVTNRSVSPVQELVEICVVSSLQNPNRLLGIDTNCVVQDPMFPVISGVEITLVVVILKRINS